MNEKRKLNLSIRQDVLKQNIIDRKTSKLEREVIEGLTNLDKSSINQGEDSDIKFKYKDEYYKEMIFNGDLDDIKKIQIIPELTDSKKNTWHIWKFFRHKISSMKMTRGQGIQLYFLIKDDTSGKYLGIMSLGSDFNNLGETNNHIGWSHNTKDKNVQYILNIKTCVPLQPFGFNFMGGKLIAMLAFSKEISDIFIHRMKTREENPKNYPILAITTTSLYGKGVQYKNLDNYMSYIGLTKGESTIHISNQLFKKCKELCVEKNIKIGEGSHSKSKITIIKKLLPKIGLKRDILQHDFKRGIYFGELYPNSIELLKKYELTDEEAISSIDTNNLKTCQEIFNEWLEKFAIKRYTSLSSRKKNKTKISIYTSPNEIKREQAREHRNNMILKLGENSLKNDENVNKIKINTETIKKRGLEIIRKQEKERKNNSKSAYKKKTFHDKYDIKKIHSLKFDKRNEHLKIYISEVENIVSQNKFSSIKDIVEKIDGASYISIRALLERIKID